LLGRRLHGNYCKNNYNYNVLMPVLGDGLITADGEHWRRYRRLIQPVFHRRRPALLHKPLSPPSTTSRMGGTPSPETDRRDALQGEKGMTDLSTECDASGSAPR